MQRSGKIDSGAEIKTVEPHVAEMPIGDDFRRRQGHLTRRLKDGFPEWKVAGLPVEAPQCVR